MKPSFDRMETLGKYILRDRQVVPVHDLFEWAEWFEKMENRRVAKTKVWPFWVSTVFLSLDHNFSMQGPPILFETMVFCRGHADVFMERCSTWSEAEEQHRWTVARFKDPLKWAAAVSTFLWDTVRRLIKGRLVQRCSEFVRSEKSS